MVDVPAIKPERARAHRVVWRRTRPSVIFFQAFPLRDARESWGVTSLPHTTSENVHVKKGLGQPRSIKRQAETTDGGTFKIGVESKAATSRIGNSARTLVVLDVDG